VLSAALAAGAVVCFRYAPADKVADRADKDASKLARTEAGAATPAPKQPRTVPPIGSRSSGPARSPSGPGLTSPGISLVAAPNADGTFEVAETVIFRAPRRSVELRSPEIRYGGAPFAGQTPTADLVQVTASGQPVLAGPVHGTKRVQLPMATDRIELRYRLAGATVRSIPSITGRALGLLSPLTATNDRALPVRLEVTGPAIRNLICPRLAPSRQQCAGSAGELGVAPLLTARTAVVIVQYNLPKPS
jgi:hypothetical protein